MRTALGAFRRRAGRMASPERQDAPTQSAAPSPDAPSASEQNPFFPDRPPMVQIEGFEILRELNHGGQGVVYEAVQKSNKRRVSIKVLLEGIYASKSAQRRFEREVELVANLKHPHIVVVFDSGTTPD